MTKRMGKNTLIFPNKPAVTGFYSVVGKKEWEGPLGKWFDLTVGESHIGEESWEKAESKLMELSAKGALEKAGLSAKDISVFLGGDLLNQCIATNYTLRTLAIPFLGLYGACSTMAESLIAGAMCVDGGFAKNVLCATSSHFCSAERQFRFPLEYGGQRPQSSQWTVTGSGATVLSHQGTNIHITRATVGKVTDAGIKDLNNMGAAMAPAACDTLCNFFADTNTNPQNYDLIITGDLGNIGKDLLRELLFQNGYTAKNLEDCGSLIFSEEQDTHSGGSGCGCSASVFNSYILKQFHQGKWQKILFIATGALMSPTSALQGESIPGIAHLVQLEKE
ncbi:MAG: stage V sporulation protein AD [Ruminococcaceae bacterium]|nr:stage V sporulation protein AD [Oscillospiraceae bacterium]